MNLEDFSTDALYELDKAIEDYRWILRLFDRFGVDVDSIGEWQDAIADELNHREYGEAYEEQRQYEEDAL